MRVEHELALQVCDLKALTDAAHERGAIVMVDNSIMTACYQKPLELGADISMISATKFVGGHSDVTGGILSFRDAELAQRCCPATWAAKCTGGEVQKSTLCVTT